MVNLKITLPENYFEEETRWGHLITTEQKKIWAVELDLLLEFDRICKTLKLPYFMDAGSLLGAVRDGHFIPWDDDIDVIMFREDYEILLQKGSDFFEYPYFLQTAYTDKGYFRAHAQLRNTATSAIRPKEGKNVAFNQGIFIDIFVLDGLTTDQKKLKKQLRDLNKFREIYSIVHTPLGRNWMFTEIKRLRARWYKRCYPTFDDLYCQLENTVQRFPASDFVDKVGNIYSMSDIHYFEREWFKEAIMIDFEGFNVPIPKKYDCVLKKYYGEDYLTPRHEPSLHGEVCFNVDRSYVDILSDNKIAY